MKKILLLFALIMTVGAVNAKTDKLYASFGTPDVNAIYGGTYAWTATNSNLMTMFEFSNGELANYSTLKFSIANLTGGTVRVGYYVGSNWTELGSGFGSDGEKTIDLTTLGDTRSDITKISFGGKTGSGSVNIAANGVYLVPSSSGDNLHATFGNPASNASYKGTNKYTWVGTTNTLMDIFTFTNGELANYSTLNFKFSDITSGKGVQIVFVYSDATTSYTQYYTAGTKNLAISNLLAKGKSAADVTKIRFGGHSNNGICTIDAQDFYLEKEYEAMDITTTITSSSDKDAPFVWSATGTLSDISNNLGKDNSGVIFGYANNNDDDHGSFNVAGYDRVTVNLSAFDSGKNTSVRLLKGTGTSNVEFSTASGTLSYTKPLTFSTCASIKAGTGASNCQDVSSIVFSKEFKATSTTAFNIAASSSSTVNYDRAFDEGEKYTICLPFALTEDEVSDAGEFYELISVSEDVLNFNKVTGTGTVAYKPYIFVPKSTGTPFTNLSGKAIDATTTNNTTKGSYTFKGVLAASSDVKGDNNTSTVYGFRAEDGKFVKVTGNSVSIKAFRAYITVPTVAGSRGFIDTNFGDGTTAIKKVETAIDDNPNAPIYNLAGQQVDANYKGVVIKNGRKQIQK